MEKYAVYENIKDTLVKAGVDYDEIDHGEVKTTEESKAERAKKGWITGTGSKNILFHAKGKFYLVVTIAGKDIKAKKFKKEFGTKDIRFAYEDELKANTGCDAGAVPPFGHFNKELPIYIDKDIFTYEYFMFNPALHVKSIRIKPEDLKKIYSHFENSVKLFEIKEDEITIEDMKK